MSHAFKARGKGNGVTPIKLGLMKKLQRQGWKLEEPLDIAVLRRPGKTGLPGAVLRQAIWAFR